MKTKISLVIGTSLLLQQVKAVQVRSFLEATGLAAQSPAAGHPGGMNIYIPTKPGPVRDYLNEPMSDDTDPQGEIAKYSQHYCQQHSDCGASGFMTCSPTTFRCVHKDLWPIKGREVLGTLVLSVLMALAVMSGVGGGGVIVSLLMYFFVLGTKEAIAINYFAIFTGAITRFALTVDDRHPDKDATSIDYGISNIMLPLVLVGTIIGVYFNILLPDVMIQGLLAVVLGILTTFALCKAIQIYKKESQMLAELSDRESRSGSQNHSSGNASNSLASSEKAQLLEEKKREFTNLSGTVNVTADAPARDEALSHVTSTGNAQDLLAKYTTTLAGGLNQYGKDVLAGKADDKDQEGEATHLENVENLLSLYEEEKGHRQWTKQGINFFLFLALLLLNIVRGSPSFPSVFGVKNCSAADWSTMVLYIGVCFGVSVLSTRNLQKEQDLKVRYGSGLASSDINLTGVPMVKLVTFSFIGGWVSGALGLGGGSIFNPLLLSLGCPPKVASATGMYMMIFSTGASIVTQIVNDRLNLPYGFFIGFFCVFGTVMGMHSLNYVMRKLGRQSPLVMLLTFILGVSAIAVPYFGFKQLAGVENLWQFGTVCDSQSL